MQEHHWKGSRAAEQLALGVMAFAGAVGQRPRTEFNQTLDLRDRNSQGEFLRVDITQAKRNMLAIDRCHRVDDRVDLGRRNFHVRGAFT